MYDKAIWEQKTGILCATAEGLILVAIWFFRGWGKEHSAFGMALL